VPPRLGEGGHARPRHWGRREEGGHVKLRHLGRGEGEGDGEGVGALGEERRSTARRREGRRVATVRRESQP
jgi:hypothetical protein